MKTLPLRTQYQTRWSRSGITLTELLIVMAILVLLVSLVGPRLLGSKKKADINAVKTQIGMFQAALERYAIDMNTFPTRQEGLHALINRSGIASSGTVGDDGLSGQTADNLLLDDTLGDPEESSVGNSNWDGPYLKQSKLPTDPWGHAYGYAYPPVRGDTDVPDIWSFGPDGKENTEDDIVSWTGTRKGTPADGDSDNDNGLVSID